MQVETPLEQLLFSTVRLTAIGADERVGTGFLVVHEMPVPGHELGIFLVTNKHVVAGAETVELTFTADGGPPPDVANPLFGQAVNLRVVNADSAFTGHPSEDVDVAVMNFSGLLNRMADQGQRPFFRTIGRELFITESEIAECDALERLVFVGYPIGLADELNLLPIMRSGHTATPLAVDYEGRPAFLIDGSIFPGQSGSPVFIADTAPRPLRTGGLTTDRRLRLVGILAQSFAHSVDGELELHERPAASDVVPVSREFVDIGVCFKARTVLEAIESRIANPIARPASAD
jgi:hypothetical protein